MGGTLPGLFERLRGKHTCALAVTLVDLLDERRHKRPCERALAGKPPGNVRHREGAELPPWEERRKENVSDETEEAADPWTRAVKPWPLRRPVLLCPDSPCCVS